MVYHFLMERLSEKLPEAYVRQMKNIVGDDYSKYIEALDSNAVRGLRVNINKISVSEFLKISSLKNKLCKLDYSDDGFIFNDDDKIGYSDEHLSGLIYIQEPSSMVPVCASGIEKEDRA